MLAPLRLSVYCAALPSQRHHASSTGGPIQSGSAIAWLSVIGVAAWPAVVASNRPKASGVRRMGWSGNEVPAG